MRSVMRTWRVHISMTSSFAGGRIGGTKGMSPGRHHRLFPFPLPRPRQIFSFFIFTRCLDLCIQTVFTFFRTPSFAEVHKKQDAMGAYIWASMCSNKIERGLHVNMLDSAPFTVRPWKNDSRIMLIARHRKNSKKSVIVAIDSCFALCLWLQSRSVLSSFRVVLMSCRVNCHVVRSALQFSAWRIFYCRFVRRALSVGRMQRREMFCCEKARGRHWRRLACWFGLFTIVYVSKYCVPIATFNLGDAQIIRLRVVPIFPQSRASERRARVRQS